MIKYKKLCYVLKLFNDMLFHVLSRLPTSCAGKS